MSLDIIITETCDNATLRYKFLSAHFTMQDLLCVTVPCVDYVSDFILLIMWIDGGKN